MKPSAPSAAANNLPASDQEDRIKHLPPEARAAFQQFQAAGDPASLDPVILSILNDYIPLTPATPLAELPGTTRLIEDLGFDSLAITEVVFFAEDLFNINITNEEIMQVRTLDDLRGFIRAKVSDRPGR
ncbi:MAG TPA: acyl carrier protein [Lacunisphaera sp.]|nr:acyl carrier protein [Lacunisphaera sp.]